MTVDDNSLWSQQGKGWGVYFTTIRHECQGTLSVIARYRQIRCQVLCTCKAYTQLIISPLFWNHSRLWTYVSATARFSIRNWNSLTCNKHEKRIVSAQSNYNDIFTRHYKQWLTSLWHREHTDKDAVVWLAPDFSIKLSVYEIPSTGTAKYKSSLIWKTWNSRRSSVLYHVRKLMVEVNIVRWNFKRGPRSWRLILPIGINVK